MIFLILSAALASAPSATDTFAFTGALQAQSRVGGADSSGVVAGATFSTGRFDMSYSAGKVDASKAYCALWSAQPQSSFTSHGACNVNGSDGEFIISFSCQAVEKHASVLDCWGRLTGVSGRYRKRTGLVSWRNTERAPAKTIAMSGTGGWN